MVAVIVVVVEVALVEAAVVTRHVVKQTDKPVSSGYITVAQAGFFYWRLCLYSSDINTTERDEK